MSFRSSKNDENILPFPGRTAFASATAASLPVLIVLHQETSTPGRVGNALRALGFPSTSAVRGSAIPCRKRWTGMPAR
jgi:GMP synthase (glutamine-hydrolysing)